MANTEKIVVQVVVQGDKDLKRLEGRTGKATAGVGKLTTGFAKMAGGIAVAVTAFRTITNAVGASIRTFRDFEFQMSKVRAVTGASNSDFKKLSGTAQDLGRTTFFTAQQVAELQTNFAKLGFTTQEILDAQEATLDLATATGSDLARAATVAGASVRGFGLDASETQRVVDVMAVAFTSSAMDIEKWQTSMTKVAPIAKASGFSIEDTAAMMSKLTDAGIEASIAGTSLRNILLKMQDPNSDLTKSFGKTIHSFDELVPAMKKFVSEGGSMADIMEVVDLRQAAAFEQMITSADATEILRDKLLDANGAASEMSDIVGDNLEGAFKRFQSALEGLAINITEGFIGKAVTGFIEKVTGIITFINEFIDTSKTLDEVTAETADSLRQESIELQEIATRYDELNSKINKNTSDRIEMSSILDTLETKLGNSVVAINEETGALELNRDALDAVIDRTALLADEEALKLVRSIRKTDREIEKQNKLLGKNKDSLRNQGLQLEEVRKTENQRFKEQQTYIQGNQMMTDSDQDVVDIRKDAILVNKETAEQEKIINSLNVEKTGITNSLKEAENKRLEQVKLLEDAGWSLNEIESLIKDTTKEQTEEVNKNTGSINENTEAKKDNFDKDAELFDLIMNRGVRTQEEQEIVSKRLNDLRVKEINLQLKSMNQFIMDVDLRKKLLEELYTLESTNVESNEDVKQASFEADVKRAIMSGQTAEEAMKTVVRAQIMEAVSGFIASIFKNVPFPANLILAAGASALVGNLIDKQLAKFRNGGMIEEYANGGMVHGRSHANGGEKFAVGGRVVELEGGEAVINKRSTAMFRGQLSAMNSAGGGVKFADGGLLNMPSFSQQQFSALGQNQMMGAMGNQGKVVVVEADITNSQNAVSVIQADANI
jgi:TP901 family phage tail tape measure protein